MKINTNAIQALSSIHVLIYPFAIDLHSITAAAREEMQIDKQIDRHRDRER